MANGTASDERELRYREKQIEFSRRWYEAHVRRAEADPDYERLDPRHGLGVGGSAQSAYEFLEFCTGRRLTTASAERDARFAALVEELDDEPDRFEQIASWWDEKKPVFLDPVLVDRCDYAYHNPDQVSRDVRTSNAEAMVTIAKYLGQALVDDLSQELGRQLLDTGPPLYWIQKTKFPRPDQWTSWGVKGLRGLGMRLWLNHKGAALGLYPGRVRKGWIRTAAGVVDANKVSGFRLMSARREGKGLGDDVGFRGGDRGSFIYGRWYDPDQLADLDLRAEAIEAAAAARPLLEALIRSARSEPPGRPSPQPSDPLESAVEKFRKDTGYPTPDDDGSKAIQPRLRRLLLADNVVTVDRYDLKKIWTGRRQNYGYPGPQSTLNRTLNNADEPGYRRIIETFKFLCWGEGDDADRIDKVLDDPRYKVKGLGESVILKLLAVCHPNRYLCLYPYGGDYGKLRMLNALGLEEPMPSASPGGRQVESNDRLYNRLKPFFPGDPWGMTCFLWWYVVEAPGDDLDRRLEGAAEDLLVERAFLDDIVELLQDKKQVILYGPPGTGKTFLALRLSEALAPDSRDRTLVQFHPSMSYEDFFEGYRPEEGTDGQIVYRLTPGPLARMSERATQHPGRRQVMVIDEINRANLPKVLGELLFLFEYRDRAISTLYRPDGDFELPRSLWFIGTMNTADRSIALVDAALRRRFHFVPFFPGRGPTEGLLERWLRENDQPSWVGDLVATVNKELTEELGPDLQLGPSHFMTEGYGSEPSEQDRVMRRIWLYNIEPFIEDQFFGKQERIAHFRLGQVVARYRTSQGGGGSANLAAAGAEPPDEQP